MKRFRGIKSEKGLVLFIVLSFTVALLVNIGGLLFSKGAKAGSSLCVCGAPPCSSFGCEDTNCEVACPPPPLPLPHLKCYDITPGGAVNEDVRLCDLFHPNGYDDCDEDDGEDVTVGTPERICTVVTDKCRPDEWGKIVCEKLGDSVGDIVRTFNVLKCYKIHPSGQSLNEPVRLCDQFHGGNRGCTEGGEEATVRTAQYLCTNATLTFRPKPTPSPKATPPGRR